MVEYDGPDKKYAVYSSTFIRLGDYIHVSTPGQPTIPHLKLAAEDNLHDDISKFRSNSPRLIDGGIVEVNNILNTVLVRGISLSFKLPWEDFAIEIRENTVELFAKQAEGYRVTMKEINPWVNEPSEFSRFPLKIETSTKTSRLSRIFRRKK